MKRFFLTTAALAALTTTAQAQDMAWNPYIGFDLMHNKVNYGNDNIAGIAFNWGDELDDKLNGLHLHVGNRFHPNFGMELGYFRTEEGSKNQNIDLSALTATPGDVFSGTKVRLQGFTLDALGYIPVAERLAPSAARKGSFILVSSRNRKTVSANRNYRGTRRATRWSPSSLPPC